MSRSVAALAARSGVVRGVAGRTFHSTYGPVAGLARGVAAVAAGGGVGVRFCSAAAFAARSGVVRGVVGHTSDSTYGPVADQGRVVTDRERR